MRILPVDSNLDFRPSRPVIYSCHVPQHPFQDLSCDVARYHVNEVDPVSNLLVLGQSVLTEVLDGGFVHFEGVGSRSSNQICSRMFYIVGVSGLLSANDGRVENLRLREEHCFNLSGRDLKPAYFDQLFLPIDDIPLFALRFAIHDIASLEVSVLGERRSYSFRIFEVVRYDSGAPDAKFSGCVICSDIVLVIVDYSVCLIESVYLWER